MPKTRCLMSRTWMTIVETGRPGLDWTARHSSFTEFPKKGWLTPQYGLPGLLRWTGPGGPVGGDLALCCANYLVCCDGQALSPGPVGGGCVGRSSRHGRHPAGQMRLVPSTALLARRPTGFLAC